jgi:hypothetical protein
MTTRLTPMPDRLVLLAGILVDTGLQLGPFL